MFGTGSSGGAGLRTALHALVGWGACGAVMGVGLALWTVPTAETVHAIAAPVIFALVSWHYFTRGPAARPLVAAVAFTAAVMLIDFLLVALVILRSLEMFGSALGTWIPFASIFASTYLVGLATRGASADARRGPRQYA